MKNFGTYIKEKRLENGLKAKDLAMSTGIDQALISKIEKGVRLPTDKQLIDLSNALSIAYLEIRKYFLAEKVYLLLKDEKMASESLAIAEPRIEYLASNHVLDKVDLDSNIIKKLDHLDAIKKVWEGVKDINGIRRQKMDEYFSMKYTYESNRIEGNTLTLSETTIVIQDGITVSGKSIQDHLEAINHAAAIEMLYDFVGGNVNYSNNILLQFHALILKGINDKYAGRYRDVPVRISGAEHKPPQPYLIEKMMEDYFSYYRMYRHSIHPVILAAEMHERLVTIHPFIDGNGRTSRLIMNLILLQHGFPIAILKGDNINRQKYYQALADVQMNDKHTAFYNLVIDALTESIEEHIELAK